MPRLKNKRQERFCREYIRRDFNGTAAARAVGCPVTSAHVQASKWLKIPKISDRVQELNDNLLNDVMMTKEEVIAGMMELASFNAQNAFDDEGRLIPIHEMDEATAAHIKEIKPTLPGLPPEIKFQNDRRAALSELMKHYNAFEDHQKSGTAEINIFLDDKDTEA